MRHAAESGPNNPKILGWTVLIDFARDSLANAVHLQKMDGLQPRPTLSRQHFR
jgi:hypothetical protein